MIEFLIPLDKVAKSIAERCASLEAGITLTAAKVEYLDRLACDKLIGKTKASHIGTARRIVDSEKSKSCQGDVIKL